MCVERFNAFCKGDRDGTPHTSETHAFVCTGIMGSDSLKVTAKGTAERLL
ncbi:MAG: hypothetical protein GY792_12635 [Gammaproteobacteria bacterium]|nr:hypothetical protein [Gammaproteobacteria bacterium]